MYRIFSQWPIFGQKRPGGLNFQRGVVGHFPAFLTIFFLLKILLLMNLDNLIILVKLVIKVKLK